jgi:hypothetical protein
MTSQGIVGAVLVAGAVIFLVGAGGWRIAYEQPMADALRVIHDDRRRRAWIHLWMIVAMFVTPAGLAGFAVVSETTLGRSAAVMAATIYAMGAVCWIASLAFRLTVTPWAAERHVADGSPPDGYAALEGWAGSLYVVHMSASYAAFAVLGGAILASGDLPAWLGWLGVGWGAVFLAGFVGTRFAGLFNPPFWAHTYTAVVGVMLLAR